MPQLLALNCKALPGRLGRPAYRDLRELLAHLDLPVRKARLVPPARLAPEVLKVQRVRRGSRG